MAIPKRKKRIPRNYKTPESKALTAHLKKHKKEPSPFFKKLLKNPENYQTRDGKPVKPHYKVSDLDRNGNPTGTYSTDPNVFWFGHRLYPIEVGVRYPSGNWASITLTANGEFDHSDRESNLDLVLKTP